MAKYGKYSAQAHTPRGEKQVHPIWRGIGCLMMLLIPVMSYAGAVQLVQANFTQRWVVVPVEWTKSVFIPYLSITVPHLYATLAVTGLLMLIGFGALVITYGMVYQVVGPPKYGPLDAPPPRRRSKRQTFKR